MSETEISAAERAILKSLWNLPPDRPSAKFNAFEHMANLLSPSENLKERRFEKIEAFVLQQRIYVGDHSYAFLVALLDGLRFCYPAMVAQINRSNENDAVKELQIKALEQRCYKITNYIYPTLYSLAAPQNVVRQRLARADLIDQINASIDKKLPFLTVDNFQQLMQPEVDALAKAMGIKKPCTGTVDDIEAGADAHMAISAQLYNAVFQKNSFFKNGKFIQSSKDYLKTSLIHELTHAHDYESKNNASTRCLMVAAVNGSHQFSEKELWQHALINDSFFFHGMGEPHTLQRKNYNFGLSERNARESAYTFQKLIDQQQTIHIDKFIKAHPELVQNYLPLAEKLFVFWRYARIKEQLGHEQSSVDRIWKKFINFADIVTTNKLIDVANKEMGLYYQQDNANIILDIKNPFYKSFIKKLAEFLAGLRFQGNTAYIKDLHNLLNEMPALKIKFIADLVKPVIEKAQPLKLGVATDFLNGKSGGCLPALGARLSPTSLITPAPFSELAPLQAITKQPGLK